jgi:hypothetical protein
VYYLFYSLFCIVVTVVGVFVFGVVVVFVIMIVIYNVLLRPLHWEGRVLIVPFLILNYYVVYLSFTYRVPVVY